MINIGINGLGRIGKSIFIQSLYDENFNIKIINAPSLSINNLEIYLRYDSIHHYKNDFEFEIINENKFKINSREIILINERDAKKINWNNYNIDLLIESSGVYLTNEKCLEHNAKKIIICSPPKDNSIPTFVYGVNHENYLGENIISNASCTTNCISPVLKILNENFKIKYANFVTIHATTASQIVMDSTDMKNRITRSIFNNIIPHSTGATSSIFKILPELDNKIFGTSLRIPVSNVSIIDLNIEFEEENNVNLEKVFDTLKKDKNNIIKINNLNLVSSDFMTTTIPSIIDKNSCLDIGINRVKLLIWYDNEWSYSAQVLRLSKYIFS